MIVFSPGLVGQVSLRAMVPAVFVMTRFCGARAGTVGFSGEVSTASSPSRARMQLTLVNNCSSVPL